MSTRPYAARHSVEGREIAPLVVLAKQVTSNKTIAVAAAGGMVLAGAAPAIGTARGAAEANNLAAAARNTIGAVSLAAVPEVLAWELEAPDVSVTLPKPKPKPPKVQRPASTGGALRTVDRSANIPESVHGNAILEIASQYVGVPYVYGGSSPSGFDCSGFTQYVYAQVGLKIPRTDSSQKAAGTVVSREDARPGDIVWFPGHVGIYAGGNLMIDSPHTGTVVQFREMNRTPTFLRFG